MAGSSRARSDVVCRFFERGYCMRGEACWFKHESPQSASQSSTSESCTPSSSQSSHDTPSQPSVTVLQANAKPFVSSTWPANSRDAEHSAASSSKMTLDTPTEEEPMCIICFERPLKFGLLESCSHVYCVDCIRTWRSERNKTIDQLSGESGLSNLKNCPACRATSNYIIPSDTWFGSGPAKEAYIQGYKDRLSTIPCKHFERSAIDNRFCPFGKDCFYAHLTADGTPHIFTHSIADHLLSTRRAREQRRLEDHLRRFYRAWRSGRLPDGHDDTDMWGESDEDDEDDYSDDDDGIGAAYGAYERAMYDVDDEEDDEESEEEDDWEDDDEEDDDDEEFEADLAEAIRQSREEARRAGIDPDAPPASVAEGTRLTSRGPVSIIGRSQVIAATQTDALPSRARHVASVAPAAAPAPPQQPQQQEIPPAHRLLTTTGLRMQRERESTALVHDICHGTCEGEFISYYDPTGEVTEVINNLNRSARTRLAASNARVLAPPNTIALMMDDADRELVWRARERAREIMEIRGTEDAQIREERALELQAAARNTQLMEQVLEHRRPEAPSRANGSEPRRQGAATSANQPRASRRRRHRHARANNSTASQSHSAALERRAYQSMPDLESLDYD